VADLPKGEGFEADSADRDAKTLAAAVSELGHRLDEGLAEFDGVATDAQRWRVDAHTSDRLTVTRSTALWLAMVWDSRVTAALESGGLSIGPWAEGLGLNVFSPTWARPAGIDDLFRADLTSHLATLPAGSRIVCADIALALLEGAQSGGPGMLPRRLRELGVDVPAVIRALRVVVADDTAVGFSQSVRDAVVFIGGEDAEVTAAGLAVAIQRIHPEYADRNFGQVALGQIGGDRRTVTEWLNLARGLYDGRVVAASAHEVMDGELLVLALGELDPHLGKALRKDGMLTRWRAATSPLPRPAHSTGTRVSHDGPAPVDLLGRTYLARTLVNLLQAAADTTKGALLVHIDGPWGSGKSTLLDYVQTELADGYLVVRVNAWREQRVGVQWWTLHRALRAALVADARPGLTRGRARWHGLVDLLRTRIVVVAAAALVGVAVIVGAVMVRWNSLQNATDVLGSLTTAAALGVGGLLAAYRFLLPGSRSSARSFEATSANPMREVRELFARTLRRADKPVVFFVDDLDRCDDDYLVEFLEVVQTLVRDALDPREDVEGMRDRRERKGVAGPYAFVAADGRWMRACYESKYGAAHRSDVPGKPLGYLFLEKIFQMHVRLPALDDELKQAFYESLLLSPRDAGHGGQRERAVIDEVRAEILSASSSQGLSDASQAARRVTDVHERLKLLGEASVRLSEVAIFAETTHELSPFGRFLEPNPRTIRLFVNSVGTLQALRTLEGAGFQTSTLALWTVVESRWPQLADHLRQHPEDIEPGPTTEPGIADLLARPDVRSVVAESEWGPLSAQDVRDCTGVGHRA